MSTIIFRGAYFRHCVIQQNEAGVFVRANVTADLSDNVCEEMHWKIGEGESGGDLKGRLEGTAVVLTPADTKLKRELRAVCSEVADFEWTEVKSDKGSTHRELRFVVRFPGEVAGMIADFKQHVGEEPSQMKLTYNPPKEQGALPLDGAQQELDTGCIACNNRIPFAEGSDTVHASGSKCTRTQETAAPLASATAMGGTHQGKRKGGQIPDPAVKVQ